VNVVPSTAVEKAEVEAAIAWGKWLVEFGEGTGQQRPGVRLPRFAGCWWVELGLSGTQKDPATVSFRLDDATGTLDGGQKKIRVAGRPLC
jgi:hypothetical protein